MGHAARDLSQRPQALVLNHLGRGHSLPLDHLPHGHRYLSDLVLRFRLDGHREITSGHPFHGAYQGDERLSDHAAIEAGEGQA